MDPQAIASGAFTTLSPGPRNGPDLHLVNLPFAIDDVRPRSPGGLQLTETVLRTLAQRHSLRLGLASLAENVMSCSCWALLAEPFPRASGHGAE